MDAIAEVDPSESVKRFLLDALADVVVEEGAYRWISEDERWRELVVCLLDETLGDQLGADGVRTAVEAAGALGLLEITDLADNEETADLLKRLLSRGVDQDAATRTITALVALCRSLVARHDGLLQRYLRRYGEIMLGEATAQLDFESLGDDAARRVMTHWLQNALYMPLSLAEPSLLDVCDSLGVTFEELREATDRLGIPLALLDDVAHTFFETETETVAESDGE